MFPYLSFMTFFPLAGALLIALTPKGKDNLVRWIALLTTLPLLVAAVKIFCLFDRSLSTMQFVEGPYPWISTFNIEYFMGIDGLSVSMILLTALVSTVAVLASWGIQKSVKSYFALLLLLFSGMFGVFSALDFFLFYVFWEVMLLPMYFLIGIWGGPRREYAAIKFFLYTLLGSVLMLLVMLSFYFYSEGHTFNLLLLADQAKQLGPFTSTAFRHACWLGLFICFAIKVPVFPFHTWLPDAHVEAPTAISVILAAVLLKMGVYGIMRICFPLFPDASIYFSGMIAALGMINIVYGALCAMAQKDFKKLIAYSSVSHMGFCLLGMSSMTAEGFNGTVLQMFNHGTITAMLFLLVGVVYDRAHHREINGFGGMATIMPRYSAITTFAFFAALGLPGLSGFVSEVLCFMGGFKNYPIYTIISVSGVVLTAAYMLWAFQRVFLGAVNEKYKDFDDINMREVVTLVPFMIIVLIAGVYPKIALDLFNSTMTALSHAMGTLPVAGL
ncbi:MAG: NADH-quinone oxidoreductase subunit M [Deltaproteobacteria bacterium]|nr:MAG: NADH-quinone oxidoreductase subunit M [Deltaproteobacteria bacterium]